MKSQPRSALITGGSRGIGAAIATLYASHGIFVTITGRSTTALNKTALKIQRQGGRVKALTADVTSSQEMTTAVQEAYRTMGSIHLLVNNAGMLELGPIQSLDLPTHRRLMEVNYFGLVQTTLLVLPLMFQQKEGHIINIASIGAKKAFPSYGAYNATKHAVAGFTDALRTELKPKGIAVTMIHPVGVDTNMGAPLKKKLSRYTLISPQKVALASYQAIRTKPAEVYVPGYGRGLSLLNQLSPSLADMLARRLT